ncbi:MAG: IS110 family transposase [Bacteroidales bacterium]|nr:IS110 family transposase [Bacteroidales bacterium]
MKIFDVVGIDVSKLTIDVVIHQTKDYQQFENSNKGFSTLLKWALSQSKATKENLLFVFEHTGLYSHNLAIYLSSKEFKFLMVPGLEIKRSLGLARGKDDKIDAAKIARYAYRLRDEITPTILPSDAIMNLKHLLSLRDRMVKQRAGYKTSLKEMKRVLKISENTVLFSAQESLLATLDKQIAKIENQIDEIVLQNQVLKRQYDLITSIKGIGPQTALYVIVTTDGFSRFNTSRSFASYCGIAPFPNKSGTTIYGKTKVSNLANKKIKSLFDLAAKSAIQHNQEMKLYYNKRIDEGKSKMSTINIIRNKLLARIFAVIKRDSLYVDIMKYAA